MAFIYNFTDLWTDGGTTYDAIKVDVTDTASAAASLLLNLSVGGSVKFSVRKDGHVVAASEAIGGATIGTNALAVTGTANISGDTTLGSAALLLWSTDVNLNRAAAGQLNIGTTTANASGFLLAAGADFGGDTNNTVDIGYNRAGLNLGSTVVIGWSSGGPSGARDTSVSRQAAGIIQFGTNVANAAGSLLAVAGTFTGRVTNLGGAAFIATNTALTDGAGASSGTLGTAPSIGNPTKWIGINDNGTTRYIPAW